MRRKPEILILFGLLIAAMAFVLWYVGQRRAKLHNSSSPGELVHAGPPGPEPVQVSTAALAPATPATSAPAAVTSTTTPPTSTPTATSTPPAPAATSPTTKDGVVDLTKPDRQTVDFSSGKPLVKNSAEDQAAIDAAMKDIKSAETDVTFEAPKKTPPPGK